MAEFLKRLWYGWASEVHIEGEAVENHTNVREWKTTLSVMFTAQLLSIMGFAFVLPFMPFYIRELGITDERLVPIWAGILAAAASLVMTIFSPLWGWLSDRHGRKIMVVRAMFAGGVITMAMGMVSDVYQLLVLRLLTGAATGTISASVSLVSAAVPRDRLGFSLGLMQVAVFLGMTLGPWIGGLLADAFGYRYTFIMGGMILLAGGILVMVGAREKFTRPSEAALKKSGSLGSLLSYPGFTTMLAVFFLFNFSVYVAMPILPLFIEAVGNLTVRVASTTGLLFAISGLAAAVSAACIGYLSDRKGYKKVLIVHLILTGVLWIFHALANSISQLMVIRFSYGLAAGGILPTMNALVGILMPRDVYGKAYGLTSSMTCLGMTLGPLAGGIMASYTGYRWPFVFVSVVLLLVVFPVASLVRTK
jgi:DHA1 family multidrug resistance protein-like MFS transporter